jgi:polar amino acid transport system substrate-binding protein
MDGVAALKSGKVTAVIYDSSGVDRILLSNPDLVKLDEELGNIEIAAVVRLEDAKLNNQLNTFISEFQADGTAAAMVERWINNTGGVMPDIPKPLNPEKKVTIITNGLTEPMNYYENGELTGYDIEFMKRFASYANLDFEIITMDYAAMIPALQSGKGDVIISDFFKTDERGQEVLYSDAYVVLHNSVLLRKSMYAGNIENADGTVIANQSQTGTAGFFASLQDSFNKTFIVEDRYKLVLWWVFRLTSPPMRRRSLELPSMPPTRDSWRRPMHWALPGCPASSRSPCPRPCVTFCRFLRANLSAWSR